MLLFAVQCALATLPTCLVEASVTAQAETALAISAREHARQATQDSQHRRAVRMGHGDQSVAPALVSHLPKPLCHVIFLHVVGSHDQHAMTLQAAKWHCSACLLLVVLVH